MAQVAQKHGASEQTIYTWRQRFAGMSADDVKLAPAGTNKHAAEADPRGTGPRNKGHGDRGAVPPDQRRHNPSELTFRQRPGIRVKELLKWAVRESLDLALIEPGPPWRMA